MQPLSILAGAWFLARADYGRLALSNGFIAMAAVAGAYIGASNAGQLAVAQGVAFALFGANSLVGIAALSRAGLRPAQWAGAIGIPLVLGGVALVVGGLVLSFSKDWNSAVRLFCVAVAAMGCYGLLAWRCLPSVLGMIRERLQGKPLLRCIPEYNTEGSL
jgi:hypothetical protein